MPAVSVPRRPARNPDALLPVVLHFFRQLQGVSYFDTSSGSYSGLAVKWKVFRIEGNYSSRSCQLCKKSNLTYGVSLTPEYRLLGRWMSGCVFLNTFQNNPCLPGARPGGRPYHRMVPDCPDSSEKNICFLELRCNNTNQRHTGAHENTQCLPGHRFRPHSVLVGFFSVRCNWQAILADSSSFLLKKPSQGHITRCRGEVREVLLLVVYGRSVERLILLQSHDLVHPAAVAAAFEGGGEEEVHHLQGQLFPDNTGA